MPLPRSGAPSPGQPLQVGVIEIGRLSCGFRESDFEVCARAFAAKHKSNNNCMKRINMAFRLKIEVNGQPALRLL